MTTTLRLILVAVALYGGVVQTGVAPRYSPGVMERVVRNRDLAPAACNISSAYYEINTWLVVYGPNTDRARRCRVSDVSHPRDVARHRRTGRIIELGYEEARVICGEAAMDDPPSACPVMVIHFG